MTPTRAALSAVVAALVVGAPLAATAAPPRFAVVIGANLGGSNDVALRYAELDAQRIAHTLRVFGDFPGDQILLLSGVTGADVRDALIRLNARLREQPEGTLLLVYYSGHADQNALRLNATTLPLGDLRALVVGSPAETRVLIVDACRSGSATRVKGALPAPSFDVVLDLAPPPRGVAILTSSTAGEDSQESEVLQASFFTHFFNSALIGAGDQNGDKRITLGEAFAFASEQTVLATMRTAAGPQHPTYRLDMGGRRDLVLTYPRNAHVPTGTLSFSDAGRYFVHRLEAPGAPAPVAEVVASNPGAHLQVAPGRYLVSSRGARQLLESEHRVEPGHLVAVSRADMRRFEYARMVRKGGAGPSIWSVSAAAGAHTSILDLGTGIAGAVGLRVDRPRFAAEGRLSLQRATTERMDPALTFETTAATATIVTMRAFDVGPLTMAIGLEVGATMFDQRVTYTSPFQYMLPYTDYSALPRRRSFGALFGPMAQVEAPLLDRMGLRLEVALPVYVADVLQANGSARLSWSSAWRATAGLAYYF